MMKYIFDKTNLLHDSNSSKLPEDYKLFLMGMVAANTACSYVFEKFFIGWYNHYYEINRQN